MKSDGFFCRDGFVTGDLQRYRYRVLYIVSGRYFAGRWEFRHRRFWSVLCVVLLRSRLSFILGPSRLELRGCLAYGSGVIWQNLAMILASPVDGASRCCEALPLVKAWER